MPDAKIPDRSVSDIYRCKWQAGKTKTTEHAAEKPVQLMQHLIRIVTKPGAIVVDPFMGSASVAVACAKHGRRYIGIERERQWFDVARERVENETAQAELLPANDGINRSREAASG